MRDRTPRRALAFGVRTLEAGDRFNILAFASSIRPFRAGLVPATEDVREAAVVWLDGLKASGGTNIGDTLQAAIGSQAQGRSRTVVFLTDGRPTVGERDPAALVRLVTQRNGSGARIFTFGVGFDLDVKLLDRIAAEPYRKLILLVRGNDGAVEAYSRVGAVVRTYNAGTGSQIIPGKLPLPGEGEVDLSQFAEYLN